MDFPIFDFRTGKKINLALSCSAVSLNIMNTISDQLKNFLNAEVEIEGDLYFSGEMTLDCTLEGDVQTEGTLHLGDNAKVTGTINAGTVVVRGRITGNISAKQKIEVMTRTEIFGD